MTIIDLLKLIANAIRTKKGTTDKIKAENFPEEINNLSGKHGFEDIGYDEVPKFIQEYIDYAKQIKNNWDSTQELLINTFTNDRNLVIMPLVDTSKVMFFLETFVSCKNLKCVPNLDTSNAIYFRSMFESCSSLKTAPILDLSKVSSDDNAFYHMFNGCTNLKNVPIYNVGSTKELTRMFYGCINLTDESLDNILQMCINAFNVENKAFTALFGVFQDAFPVSRLEKLPHYQAFIDAGWTIGY